MPKKKRGNGWTHVKKSKSPVPRTPPLVRHPPPLVIPGAQPSLRQSARRNHEHILTHMLHQEVDITRNIFRNLTMIEALTFASTSHQLRRVFAEQASGTGPPNIDNIANWFNNDLDCQEDTRGGYFNASFGLCGNQGGLRSCMGPFGPPFENRKERNPTDFHRPHICRHCQDRTNAACTGEEHQALLLHQTGMCTACERRWRERHPLGWRTCICKTQEEQWYCWFCRTDKQEQWGPMKMVNELKYKCAYKARVIGFAVSWHRAPEMQPRCHCGEKHKNHAQRNVAMCFVCEGIVVAPVTGNRRRRSARAQQIYDDEDRLLPRR